MTAAGIVVRPYAADDAGVWDELVAASPMGTLLHTRRFLSYHEDRFEDASALVLDEHGRVAGLLPAARDPGDERRVVSHPGVTYGGLVHAGDLSGAHCQAALEALAAHYAGAGFERLEYRPVPWIYHRVPSGDDLYALFRLHAARTRCDLSSAVDLQAGWTPSSRRRRGLRKAQRAGAEIARGRDLAAELWRVVEAALAERHGARPVHSLAEIELLAERFPEEIEFVAARLDGDVVAGVVLFHSATTTHAQYIASTPEANRIGALDAVFAACLEDARDRGRRFFDFGTSNRDGGRTLNATLYGFKAEFGGGGVPYEFYELGLPGTV